MGIRYYKPGDEKQILQLFTKVFDKPRDHRHWKWKYLDHPEESNPWVLVYEENGTLLGHIALWVADAYIYGQPTKVALRVDTMVDPDARGKGIYKKLNEHMVEEAGKSGIAYLYGFPAEKAKDLLLRYTNGTHITDISRYMKIYDPVALLAQVLPFMRIFLPIGKLYKKMKYRNITHLKMPEGYSYKILDRMDEGFTALAEEARNLRPFLLKRNAAYLNWRYRDHPDNHYKIIAIYENDLLKGYVITKEEKIPFKKGSANFGFIIDWLALEEPVWKYLLKLAVKELENTDVIQAWGLPANAATNALGQIGFKEKDRPMPLIVHNLTGDTKLESSPDNWWITQGDIDSF